MFVNEVYKTFKEKLMPIFIFFHKIEEVRKCPNLFYEANITFKSKADKDNIGIEKLQINIPEEYSFKNSQQNTSK